MAAPATPGRPGGGSGARRPAAAAAALLCLALACCARGAAAGQAGDHAIGAIDSESATGAAARCFCVAMPPCAWLHSDRFVFASL